MPVLTKSMIYTIGLMATGTQALHLEQTSKVDMMDLEEIIAEPIVCEEVPKGLSQLEADFLSQMYAESGVQDVQFTCDYSWNRFTVDDGVFEAKKNSGGKFVDSEFPAEESSLYWASKMPRGQSYDGNVKNSMDSVDSWKRPSELDSNPSLFGSKGVLPNGVNQGQLGDCWFLASAAAVAEWPERIEKIFTNTEYPDNGLFEVEFYAAGKPEKVYVDDQLPFISKYESLFSTKMSENGAWWMPILEKAYAKSQVNYMNLNGGFTNVALRALTGMPTIRYRQGQQNDWSIIQEADAKGYIMTSGCMQSYFGLIPGHAYTLVGAKQLSNGVKLVRMRNPWGIEKYVGPYSDDSSEWTAALKSEVDYVDKDDGFFYMLFDHFQALFPDYVVTKWKDDYEINTIEVENGGAEQMTWYTLSNPTEQEVTITIDWAFPANYPPSCSIPSSQANWNMYIFDKNQRQVLDQQPVSSQFSYGVINKKLPAGDYKFLIYNFGQRKVGQSYTITQYSDSGFTLTEQ